MATSHVGNSTPGALPAQPHTYADDGTYHVTVQITDQWGNISPATATIIVDNVAPTATITGAPASGHSPEATAITLGSTVTDPSTVDTAAGFSYSWTVTRNGTPSRAYRSSIRDVSSRSRQ